MLAHKNTDVVVYQLETKLYNPINHQEFNPTCDFNGALGIGEEGRRGDRKEYHQLLKPN
ncbi:hypothetical protein [Nostoc sp. FACHB-888]|uniref:hypothetical protein n=1 Tax=Nostoc sp. FACHB-888 TaxID=2692842 RepID=UPI001683F103|nr:hypothetical protein [Nostoc sp. FACHB-888]MBD2246288.1 hypothetical protein [Nostoc sp. FACHB-888]